ncbi:MAG: phosphopantetheine-binding protein [Crocinitomicaceae bacterium]
MEEEKVFENVRAVIEKSIGKPKSEIQPKHTLFDELGIDSIDLVDILFELEFLYGVELKISDIEKKAREQLGDTPYEIEGYITAEGLQVIQDFLPELNKDQLKEGITVHQLVKVFTVQSLCKIVIFRIEEENAKKV